MSRPHPPWLLREGQALQSQLEIDLISLSEPRDTMPGSQLVVSTPSKTTDLSFSGPYLLHVAHFMKGVDGRKGDAGCRVVWEG